MLYAAVVPEADKSLPAQMLGLVRPIAIDNFKIRGIDLSDAAEVPAALHEGDGYRAMIASADPTRRVVVTGKIWARSLHRVITHNDSFDDATAAFVFSEDEHHALSPEEMKVVAFKGRAVSPVTSYLATEPGVRPSTDGLLELEGTSVGAGGMGLAGVGHGGGGMAIALPKLADLLAPAVARCVQVHAPPPGWAVGLAVETTGPEIVDVTVTRATHAALRSCVVAAVWALELGQVSARGRARTARPTAIPAALTDALSRATRLADAHHRGRRQVQNRRARPDAGLSTSQTGFFARARKLACAGEFACDNRPASA